MQQEVNLSPQQVQAAAQAGLGLLSDPELRVSVTLAVSGHLNYLSVILQGIAAGTVILANPPRPQPVPELKQIEKSA